MRLVHISRAGLETGIDDHACSALDHVPEVFYNLCTGGRVPKLSRL